MIDVEIIVAGALGELAQSMIPELGATRMLLTRLVVANERAAGTTLAQLEAAGLEVIAVTELPHDRAHTSNG